MRDGELAKVAEFVQLPVVDRDADVAICSSRCPHLGSPMAMRSGGLGPLRGTCPNTLLLTGSIHDRRAAGRN